MTKKRWLCVVVVVLPFLTSATLLAQSAITADGIVESTVGGFKFPDGTFQMTAAAGRAPVEDTGQTECWDTDGLSRPCTGTGEDGELQAGVAWPTPRFTDNSDGTVTDNLTGLIWLKDADCPAGTMPWQDALNWVVLLNNTSIACTDYVALTYSDWRLPNIRELTSVLDYGTWGLPSGHPFTNVQPYFYWSSTSSGLDPSSAWDVKMDFGSVFPANKTSTLNVWPVRSGR